MPWRRLNLAVLPFPLECPVEEGAILTLDLYWSILLLAISQLQHSFSPHCSPRTAPPRPEIPRGAKSETLSAPHLPTLLLQAGTWETPLPSGRF